MNWQSFSQVAFAFAVTPALLIQGIVSAAMMGLLGGLFPAIRAARLPDRHTGTPRALEDVTFPNRPGVRTPYDLRTRYSKNVNRWRNAMVPRLRSLHRQARLAFEASKTKSCTKIVQMSCRGTGVA